MSDAAAISVAIRTRPLLENERYPVQPIIFEEEIVQTPTRDFHFDHVFKDNASNVEVYNSAVAKKIPHIFDGYNVTILAYGSTGSGKTYTMGTDYNPKSSLSSMGIIPQGLTEIFQVLESQEKLKSFLLKVSFVELYQEIIFDLLHPDAKNLMKRDIADILEKTTAPKIVEDKHGNFKVLNVVELPVTNVEEALGILLKGSALRHTAATAKNAKSSRSHAIFTVSIEQVDKVTFDSKCAKFQLVDLAGSERMATSKTQGVQAKEGTKINLSLLVLSKVITALSEKRSHIPYRESKLTRLLADSLGGNSHTVMIACVNPSSTSYDETLSTLRYADSARNIQNKPKINVDTLPVQVEKLKKQVKVLQNQITEENSTGLAKQLLDKAYSTVSDLILKQDQLQEINGCMLSKMTSIFDRLRSIVAEMTPMAAANNILKPYLDQLEDIIEMCVLVTCTPETSSDVPEIGLDTINEYGDSESALLVDADKEDGEEGITPLKTEEQLCNEMDQMVKKHENSTKRLEEIKIQYKMTKDFATMLEYHNENCENPFEQAQADTLTQKIETLVKEKADLEISMKKDQKCIVEHQNKILKYENDIKKLQEELFKVKKSLQQKDENKNKVLQYKRKMEDLQKLKVKYMKEVSESNKEKARLQRGKDEIIRKLTREKNQKVVELSKMQIKCGNQIRVLESRCKQAIIAKQVALTALKKNNPPPPRTGVKSKQSQASLEEWIDGEIKRNVQKNAFELTFKSLYKEADELKENIKKIEELTGLEQNEEQERKKENLKGLLQIQLNHIDEMRNVYTAEDHGSKSWPWLNELSDATEARPIIKYLFNTIVSKEVEAVNQVEITKEKLEKQEKENEVQESKFISVTKERDNLKLDLQNKEWSHKQEVEQLVLKHELEKLQLTAGFKTESPASPEKMTEGRQSIKRSLEVEEYDTLLQKYKKKCEETDQLHKQILQGKKGKGAKWLSSMETFRSDLPSTSKDQDVSMMEEYLLTDEDESFNNDRNDPDWRLTPLHKQSKRPKLDEIQSSIQVGESSVKVIPTSGCPMDKIEKKSGYNVKPHKSCKCEGECKPMRCRCLRNDVSCTEGCACSKEKCSNK